MPETKWEVQTYTLTDGWINCWREGEEPLLFDTIDDARAALTEFFEDLAQAGMIDDYDREDYRIVRVFPLTNTAPEEKIAP